MDTYSGLNPTNLKSACKIVAGLLVFLKDIWKDTINTEKFNKFFTALALKRSKDAWWDSNNHCVVTQADTELGQILEQDQDLFFSVAVAVDLGTTNYHTPNKDQMDIMSTGSISTCRSMATTTTQQKTKWKPQTTNKNHNPSDQVSVMTGTILLEKDVNALLKCFLNAMQAKNLVNHSTMAPVARILE